MNRVKWCASLSNGEVIYEGKGEYAFIKGDLSPYQKLLNYLKNSGVKITSLSLYTDEGLRWILPSEGKNPRFHIFSTLEKPIAYNFFRKYGEDLETKESEIFAVIEAVYSNYKLQIWVRDMPPYPSWSLIIKK